MLKRNLLTILVACFTFVIPAMAFAEGHSYEHGQDGVEIREDIRQIFDDALDLARLEAQLAEFDRHVQTGNHAGLDEVDMRLRHILDAEADESQLELEQDQTEIALSRRELSMDEVNHRYYMRHGRTTLASIYGLDVPDDRADLQDDRQDLVREYDSTRLRDDVRREMSALYGEYSHDALQKKRALIQELIRVAEMEVAANDKELREDRDEWAEDRYTVDWQANLTGPTLLGM